MNLNVLSTLSIALRTINKGENRMKNFKKVLSSVLACVTLLSSFAFASCDKSKDQKPEVEQIVLADFEKFEPDFQLIRLSKHFGAVNVNTDSTYVKSGTTSAKVQPLGHVPSKSQPMMFFPLFQTGGPPMASVLF